MSVGVNKSTFVNPPGIPFLTEDGLDLSPVFGGNMRIWEAGLLVPRLCSESVLNDPSRDCEYGVVSLIVRTKKTFTGGCMAISGGVLTFDVSWKEFL